MINLTNEELINKAYEAMEKAYAPYSRFLVGAALITEEGKIFTGCNIENASYGVAICAERTAIAKAVSEGYTKIKKIAVVASTHEATYPCGICRQVLSEFMDNNGIILTSDEKKGIQEYSLEELLPYSFKL